MVLLAVCDVDYCFTMNDFRSYKSKNDSGILANSNFGKRLELNWLNIPPDEPLNGCKFSLLPFLLAGWWYIPARNMDNDVLPWNQ